MSTGNSILQIFQQMTDQELNEALDECVEAERKGLYSNIAMEKARLMKEITGEESALSPFFATMNIWREAAYRYRDVLYSPPEENTFGL
jgi:hypothetical protein